MSGSTRGANTGIHLQRSGNSVKSTSKMACLGGRTARRAVAAIAGIIFLPRRLARTLTLFGRHTKDDRRLPSP